MKLLSYLLLLFFSFPVFASSYSMPINGDEDEIQRPHGKFHWEAYRGFIPSNAVAGGQEPGRTLFICQASYMNGLHPGKMVDRRCNITYGGREIPRNNFRILVGHDLRWVDSYGRIPHRAIVGGNENGNPLYLCQATKGKGTHPGKIVAGNCNIGYAGKELIISNYRILVTKKHRMDQIENDDEIPTPVIKHESSSSEILESPQID